MLLRAIRLRVVSDDDAAFGTNVSLQRGLNVIRADNSRGKTQLILGLIYALGLEHMLTRRNEAPLGSALTTEIADGTQLKHQVRQSWVAVEIENHEGRIVTVQRHVVHGQIDSNLIRVWEGPVLTRGDASATASSDMFVNRSGAASGGSGFHYFLSRFLGWELPAVPTFTGSLSTLYLDVIFPFLIVDQQSWFSAAPRKVDRYQIRDPLRRAVEFLLALAGPEAEQERAELEATMASLRTKWAAERAAAESAAYSVGGRIVGIPEHAAGANGRQRNPEPSTLSGAGLEVLEGDEWLPLLQVRRRLEEQLQLVRAGRERTVELGADSAVVEALEDARTNLADALAAAAIIDSDLTLAEAQLAVLDRRLDALQEERARNVDVRTLIRLGSDDPRTHLADDNCPTCQQSLDPVEAHELGPVLDVDDTINFLNAQIATAQKMRAVTQRSATEAASSFQAIQRNVDHLRAQVRGYEADVLTPTDAPSVGEITRLVTTELRIDELSRAESSLAAHVERLTEFAREIADTRGSISSLPDGVPDEDRQKLSDLNDAIHQRLSETHFGSYSVDDVTLDADSLRPTRAGFDVDTDASASDVVRMKVAYLDSVRAEGQRYGRHPGLLVLDEPRQQDIDARDYAAMLRYLADGSRSESQIVVTSATPLSELSLMLAQSGAAFVDLGSERLIKPEPRFDAMDRS